MSNDIGFNQTGLNTGAIKIGASLMGIGMLFASAGAAVCAAAFAGALRQHVKSADMPPSELAMNHWKRVKSAAHAGIDAWGGPAPVQIASQRQASVSTVSG